MKIFWSWQSDNHQPTGRYFVRDVLNEVARELSGLDAIEDADRPESDDVDDDIEGDETGSTGRITVDHDMKGIAGHAPIADTILKKIAQAAVFVADLSPIAKTAAGKLVPNPNVMIELGYAIKALGHQRLILIVNQVESGKLDKLPFDLRHWSAPVAYKLARDATPERIAEEKARLKAQLKPKIVAGLKVAEREMREASRSADPQPELELSLGEGMPTPQVISQRVELPGVPSLADIKAKTPQRPLPRASTQSAIFPTTRLSRSFEQFAHRPPERWDREETEGYNRTLGHYYDRYERYLEALADHRRLALRTFEFKLDLENRGLSPATNITLTLTFPQQIQLYDVDDGFPAGPDAPKPPPLRPVRSGEGIAIATPMSIDIPRLLVPYHLRSLHVDVERNRVRFEEKILKHYESMRVDPFLVSFRTGADIGDFEVPYSITVNEPIEPSEGTLLFTVAQVDEPIDRPDEP